MGDLLGSGRDLEIKAPQVFTIGVLSDTHVPDRRRKLDPRILQCFQSASVDLILHAGDISTQAVLDELSCIAPVRAVRGNRDWMMLGHLPSTLTMEINGVRLTLIHGHGSLIDYVQDRLNYFVEGFRIERYLPRLIASFPASQAITAFSHRAMCSHCSILDLPTCLIHPTIPAWASSRLPRVASSRPGSSI